MFRVSQSTVETHTEFQVPWGVRGHSRELPSHTCSSLAASLSLCLPVLLHGCTKLGFVGRVPTVPDTQSPPQHSFQDQPDKPLPVPSSQCCE